MLAEDYINGFLVACSSFSFFARKDYSEDWIITNLNKDLLENIEPELETRINSMKEEDKEYLIEQKKLIEEFFN